jgi:predicted NBD/HSP70 family sugar kinase
MAWRLGVDCRGTFTDICLFDEDGGRVEVWKTTSTPDDPSRGIAQGLAEAIARFALAAAGMPLAVETRDTRQDNGNGSVKCTMSLARAATSAWIAIASIAKCSSSTT